MNESFFVLHPLQCSALSVFWILGIWMDVQWYVIVVLNLQFPNDICYQAFFSYACPSLFPYGPKGDISYSGQKYSACHYGRNIFFWTGWAKYSLNTSFKSDGEWDSCQVTFSVLGAFKTDSIISVRSIGNNRGPPEHPSWEWSFLSHMEPLRPNVAALPLWEATNPDCWKLTKELDTN